MRVAVTIDGLFADDDEPRCYIAPRFLFWAGDEEIGGHAVWGAPDRSDAEEFVRILERGVAEARTPGRLIIDFSELLSFESGAFDVLAHYFGRHKEEIDRQAAVVRPDGAVGAMVAGFFDVVDLGGRATVVTSVEEACRCLGRPDAVPLAREAYRLRDERGAHHGAVDRLRALLSGDQPPESVDAAAKAMRISTRTLQHWLREEGTSYRQERDRARLDRARGLLRAGTKLAAVALEVGFSTPQHFSTWFKRETGMTPSAWRNKHGAGS